MKKQFITYSLASLALALLVPVAGVIAATDSKSTVINATVNSTISITTSNLVTINAQPDAQVAIGTDQVRVSTNNTTGYKLNLKALTQDTLSSGPNTIAATSGSFEAPAALDDNSWGFRVDGAGGFGAGPTLAETNQANSAHTWAAVPANGAAKTIKTTSVATSSSGDATKVWYAIKVDASKPGGEYRGTVSYTATTR